MGRPTGFHCWWTPRRRSVIPVGLACVLMLAGRVAADDDGYRYVTPWLRTKSIPPAFEIPHIVRFGATYLAEVRQGDGAWRTVYRGERSREDLLDDHGAVLIRAAGEVYREGAKPVRFPGRSCGGWWPNSIFVPGKLDRVVCVHAAWHWGCGLIEVAQFNLAGTLLRRDVLGRPTVCTDAKWDGAFNSHLLGGLTAALDPVVAVQVGQEPDKRIRYAIFVLEPSGPREIGRYTNKSAWDICELRYWPSEAAAVVVHRTHY